MIWDGKRHFRIVTGERLGEAKLSSRTKRFIYEKTDDRFHLSEHQRSSRFQELKNKYKPEGLHTPPKTGSLLYGSVWLLMEIATKIGLMQNLMAVFGGNVRHGPRHSDAGVFSLLCGKSYNHLAQWHSIERMPFGPSTYQ